MRTLNDYFRVEARDFIAVLERGVQRRPAPDAAELLRAARGLRGTAQLAREQRVFEVAAALEAATRSLAGGALPWTDDVAQRTRATIGDLRALIERTESDDELDVRVTSATSRWRGDTSDDAAPVNVTDGTPGDSTAEFRAFAAREAAGIAQTLDRGITDLQTNPMDREPLRAILRRQRALLGAARLEEVQVVAEILRALEDLTRVIVKLDIGVKREWLDVYRVARDGIQATVEPLLRNELPAPTHAVSRLRHMHAELTERYGAKIADPDQSAFVDPATVTVSRPIDAMHSPAPVATDAPPTRPTAQPAATQPMAPFIGRTTPAAAEPVAPVHVAEPADEPSFDDDVIDLLELDESSVIVDEVDESLGGDVLAIDELTYGHEDALTRALDMQDGILDAAAHDPQLHAMLIELFDLIRAARG